MEINTDTRIRWKGTPAFEVLERLYPAQGAEAVAKEIGCTPEQVRSAAAAYGIRRGGRKKYVRYGTTPVGSYALTPREVEVLRNLAAGLGAQDAANAMGISLDTVRDYVKSIFRKMSVRTTVAAVLLGERDGLLVGVEVRREGKRSRA